MKHKRIFLNAVMSIIQILVLGVTVFFLYRYLLDVLGIEKLGVWSLVVASSSVTRIANLGLSGSVVKFVAKYAAHDQHQTVARLLETAILSTALGIGLLLLIILPFMKELLQLFLADQLLMEAVNIMPVAMLSVWLSTISLLITGGLDGYQRIDLRSQIMSISAILYTGLSILLVKRFDLLGLAYAQVLQYVFVGVVGIFFLRRLAPIPMVPHHWDKTLFKEMFAYGINFQAITLVTMLYEPVTKALLAWLGNIADVGYYEMASRMITQFRSLVVSANQVLVPAIADMTETIPEQVQDIYRDSLSVVSYITIPLYFSLAAFIPSISILWIGTFQPTFIAASYLLIVGWCINTLAAPAYFAYLGDGRLQWNTYSHITIGVLNVLFGSLLGWLWGGIGVIAGWSLALVIGSIVIIASYHQIYHCSWKLIFSRANFQLLLAGCVILFCTLTFYYRLANEDALYLNVSVITMIIILIGILPMWLHPIRARLIQWIFKNTKRHVAP